jgi:flagellar FliL protein
VLSLRAMSEEAQAVAPPTHGNKNLLMLVLAINVLIAGGLVYQTVMGQASRAAAKGGEHKPDPKEAPTFGPLLDVGSLVANLGGPSSGHYMKVSLHIETPNEEVQKRLEKALVPIRAEALLYLSSIESKDIGGQDQMRVISGEMKKRLGALVGKDAIKRVYFSEFVVE